MPRIERTASIEAPPDAVWSVLADFGAISTWVPIVAHSCLLSERTEGVGTVRRVQIGRQTLVERVVTWDPPRELAYDVDGLPPIVGDARSSWRVEPTSSGADVALTSLIETGWNPAKVLIARRVLARVGVASELMLARLAEAVAAGTGGQEEDEWSDGDRGDEDAEREEEGRAEEGRERAGRRAT